MKSAADSLLAAIDEQLPLVLILGQSASSDRSGRDTILEKAIEKAGRSHGRVHRWPALLSPTSLNAEFYDWLSGVFHGRVHPPHLTSIAELPWCAVFSSAIDPTLTAVFQGHGRRPEAVLTATETPIVARSTTRTPIYYLFGSAASTHPTESPPVDRATLNTRRIGHAVPLLGRALETATALGTVAVDGFIPGNDWLALVDLLGAVGNAAPGQVLWFGGRPELARDDAADFDALTASGRVIVENESLATVISSLRARHRLPDLTLHPSEDSRVITIRRAGRIETTPELRLRVEAVASIVDDSWTAFLPPLGPDSSHFAFRRFHGNFETPRSMVDGIRRGFAIEREFEAELHRRVSSALTDHARLNLPILVQGQSGTGKSVALARLVSRLRQDADAAVLYSLTRVPQSHEVSEFCELADRSGSPATVIVSDANRDLDVYRDLLLRLRSQGRRVIVVGSQYRVTNGPEPPTSLSIAAPVELSRSEQAALANLLKSYLDDDLQPDDFPNANILACLYRLLPSSRPRISTGLGDEAKTTQRQLLSGSQTIRRAVPTSQIAQQLISAGLAETYPQLFSERQSQSLEAHDVAGRIIDLVMVAGSLNCPVPFNLLLRCATGPFPDLDLVTVTDMFRDMDLFRWRWADAEHSELLVSPRIVLEAQLICRRRLGNRDEEADRVLDLIRCVRATGVDRDHERRFLLNLLQQLGADGPRAGRYQFAYARIATALTELRERYGIYHPSIVLQESAFRRMAIRHNVVPDTDRLRLLEEARDVIQRMMDDIARDKISVPKQLRRNLEVERASVYGFLATGLTRRDSSPSDIWSSYEAARIVIRQAVSVTDNYYPFDIGLWTPADLLSSGSLTPMQCAELAADIRATLTQVEPAGLSPAQLEKFHVRRAKVGDVLGDQQLTDDAYRELEANGSTAGFFLRAQDMGPDYEPDEVDISDALRIRQARRAARYLTDHIEAIEDDDRCLFLLLEYRWISELGRRPFRGTRQPLPSTRGMQVEFLGILRSLNHASGDAARYATRYLEAALTWVAEDERLGIDQFRELSRDTSHDDPGRVVRRHLLSDDDGVPQRFSGRVEAQRSEGHWVIRIEPLRRKVNLLARDFPHDEIAYGRTVRNIAVAFNYIGPIADPIRH